MTIHFTRRHVLTSIALAAAMLGAATQAFAADNDDGPGLRHGKLFVSTNSPVGNEVLVYARAEAGPATLLARASTSGYGTGVGLGSQGAVTLARNGKHLFVVNALSNTVSTFAVRDAGLILTSVVDSGGLRPTSITESDGLVYVLNAGGAGGVAGFRHVEGVLHPLADGQRGLSASTGTAPAQVGFDQDGEALVVTERNTNLITSFKVRPNGTLGPRLATASAGAVPFGFAITRRNMLVVSEAAGSTVSSYRIGEDSAMPLLVSGAVPTTQGAACWIAVSPSGRFAFSANAATSSISSFAVAGNGALTLLAGAAGSTGINAGALDTTVSPDGKQLNVLAPRSLKLVSFAIGPHGALTPLGEVGGFAAGAAGLAVN